MEQKETKLGFFSRLKKAIFELEDYGFFLGEKLTVAFKYFFILIFIISVIFSLSVTYKSFEIVKTAHNYINNELPDFEYKDGKQTKYYSRDGAWDIPVVILINQYKY